ncbi:iduronate 2-sulfatase-like [Babylonia areolata]|uniref:iduronate 2-sulfatase-like n=1 Tax=Babylonia areolata TaxID=304850 RepID=UPI003FD3F7C9
MMFARCLRASLTTVAVGVVGVVVVSMLLMPARVSGTEHGKRQLHHTQAPHHTHTHAPADPLAAWLSSTASSRPNVLFLIADDLRPKLGCYGDSNMVTPNLDYLAGKSVRFDQAFVQIALCSPSRTSFLTGRRPETTRVFDLHTYFRKVAGNFTTLPEYFKQHGYLAQGVGKIYHPGEASGNTDDFPYSWSAETYLGDNPFNSHMRKRATVQPVNETATGKLQDSDIAEFAVNFLRQRAHSNTHQPFFLAVGFHKPHLPWIFPQQYLDLYPRSKIHLAEHRTRPPHLPDIAWSQSGEIRSFGDIKALNITDPDGIIPDYYQYTMRQAYSAATSYMDANVGKVMHALDQYGFSSNTIVSFLGDHGWHLGDNAEWCKHTNFDMALRVPMMLYVPGVTSTGSHFDFLDPLAPGFNPQAPELHRFGTQHSTKELVEAVDLYPTLIELAGLPLPDTCPENSLHVPFCTEGTSLLPLLRQVRNLTQNHQGGRGGSSSASSSSFTWKDAAFSVYHRQWGTKHPVLGYSVRTKTHRYTEWVYYDKVHSRPNFDHVVGRELYRHSDDPFEFSNLAELSASGDLVAELSRMVRQGWRKTLQDYLGSAH